MAFPMPSLDFKGGSSEASATTTGESGATGAGTKQSLFINLAARDAKLSATADTGGSLKPSSGGNDLIWYAALGVGAVMILAAMKRKA